MLVWGRIDRAATNGSRREFKHTQSCVWNIIHFQMHIWWWKEQKRSMLFYETFLSVFSKYHCLFMLEAASWVYWIFRKHGKIMNKETEVFKHQIKTTTQKVCYVFCFLKFSSSSFISKVCREPHVLCIYAWLLVITSKQSV